MPYNHVAVSSSWHLQRMTTASKDAIILREEVQRLNDELEKANETINQLRHSLDEKSLQQEYDLLSHLQHLQPLLVEALGHVEVLETEWVTEHTAQELKEAGSVILGGAILKQLAKLIGLPGSIVHVSWLVGGCFIVYRISLGSIASWGRMLNRNAARKAVLLRQLEDIQDRVNIILLLQKQKFPTEPAPAETEPSAQISPAASESSSGVLIERPETRSPPVEEVDEEAMEPLRKYAMLGEK